MLFTIKRCTYICCHGNFYLIYLQINGNDVFHIVTPSNQIFFCLKGRHLENYIFCTSVILTVCKASK